METGGSKDDIHAPCLALIAELRAQLVAQEKRIRDLEARLNKNSQNSSRPPSSDPPGAPPRPKKPPTGRSPGGQPGHEGHHRPLLPPDQVNQFVDLKPSHCGKCGHALSGQDPDPTRHQVAEIPEELKARITEYLFHELTCTGCGEATRVDRPLGVPGGAFGPRLQAFIAYLSGKSHQSKRLTQDVLADFFGVDISLGAISAVEETVSAALAAPVEEASAWVQRQPVVHADETSWPVRGKNGWLWAAVTGMVSIFMIHAHRGKQAARDLLGQFAGHLVTDRWSVYAQWPVERRQLCWAHLKRDFEGFLEFGKEAAKLGTALSIQVGEVFRLWHRIRDGTLQRSSIGIHLDPICMMVRGFLECGAKGDELKVAGKCREILKLWPALWTFAHVEGVEPTNNPAERAIRPAVLYRKGCFGTQSEGGSRFVSRILTAVTTLRQQKRNVLQYLTRACEAHQTGQPPPSLLPV